MDVLDVGPVAGKRRFMHAYTYTVHTHADTHAHVYDHAF